MENSEQALLKLAGQTLKFIWRSGAVKIFAVLLLIATVGFFAFSFRVSPILAFVGFIAIVLLTLFFLMFLIWKKPDLFQDSGTWLNYQELLIGNKQTGLQLPESENIPVQPVIKTTQQSISGKARIIKAKNI